jgi:hypothetical protein
VPAPEPGSSDREDAGAAAEVEDARACELVPEVDQELQAEPRRRMAAGPEGAGGLDEDRDRVGRRPLPGRADPERADAHGPVELAPALLPARLDLRTRNRSEPLPHPRLARLVGVRGELDVPGPLALLEPLGEELDEDGSRGLRFGSGHDDGDAPQQVQRKTLFSFSKKPSFSR